MTQYMQEAGAMKQADGYTREGFLRLLHERLAAAHLAGRDNEGFPVSSLKLLMHYFDQLAPNEGTLTAGKQGGDGVATVPPSLTDAQAEALIEASDGHWKEDVFCIGGPELMALLRAARGVAAEPVAWRDAHDHALLYTQKPEGMQVEPLYLAPGVPAVIPAHELTGDLEFDAPAVQARNAGVARLDGSTFDAHQPMDSEPTK